MMERLKADDIGIDGKTRRIGGWGRELEEWKQAVIGMVRSK